jgi:hypothetical protein
VVVNRSLFQKMVFLETIGNLQKNWVME